MSYNDPFKEAGDIFSKIAGGSSREDIFTEISNGKTAEEYRQLADDIKVDLVQEMQEEDLAEDWPDVQIDELEGVRTVQQPDLSAGRWLTHYTDYAKQCSPMSPEIYHEALGLWILSTAIARRVVLSVSALSIYPNLYVLLIGPPGLVRKTSALKVAERVLSQAGVLLLPGLGTVEALSIELAADRMPTNLDKRTKDYERWLKERALAAQRGLLVDEASGLFDAGRKDYMAQLKPLILEWYDCPAELKFTSTVSRGRAIIEDSYLTLAGATTPGAMRRYFGKQSVEWEDGTWSRFNLITYETLPGFDFFSSQQVDPPHNLVKRLDFLYRHALKLPTVEEIPQEKVDGKVIQEVGAQVSPLKVVSITIVPEAWQAWEQYAKALHTTAKRDYRQGGQKLSPLYTRIHFHAIKIAILLAVADWSDASCDHPLRVESRHWERAQWICERWRASLHRVDSLVSQYSDDQGAAPQANQVQRDAESLLGLIRRKRVVTNRDITQHISRWSGEKEKRKTEALKTLLDQGAIEYNEKNSEYTLSEK